MRTMFGSVQGAMCSAIITRNVRTGLLYSQPYKLADIVFLCYPFPLLAAQANIVARYLVLSLELVYNSNSNAIYIRKPTQWIGS